MTILRKDNCLDEIEGKPVDATDEKLKEMDDTVVANLHLAIMVSIL